MRILCLQSVRNDRSLPCTTIAVSLFGGAVVLPGCRKSSAEFQAHEVRFCACVFAVLLRGTRQNIKETNGRTTETIKNELTNITQHINKTQIGGGQTSRTSQRRVSRHNRFHIKGGVVAWAPLHQRGCGCISLFAPGGCGCKKNQPKVQRTVQQKIAP